MIDLLIQEALTSDFLFRLLFLVAGKVFLALDKRRRSVVAFLLLSLDSNLSVRKRRYAGDVNTAAFCVVLFAAGRLARLIFGWVKHGKCGWSSFGRSRGKSTSRWRNTLVYSFCNSNSNRRRRRSRCRCWLKWSFCS